LTDSDYEGHNEDQDGDANDGFSSQVPEAPWGLEEGLKGQEKRVGGSEYGAEKERGNNIMTKTKTMAVKAGMKEEWANDFWEFRQTEENTMLCLQWLKFRNLSSLERRRRTV
jgi:hypothetical protein